MSDEIRYVDLDAERRYLGAALHDLDSLDAEPIDARDFGAPKHALLLAVMRTVLARGGAKSSNDVLAELKLTHRLERIGGVEGFHAIYEHGTLAWQVSGDARVIRELARKRRLDDALATARARLASGYEEDARELARIAADERTARVQSVPEHVLLADLYADLQRPAERRTGAATGMPLLDAAIGGLPAGSMCVVGGRTGSRKSSLMLSWAVWQSENGHRPGIVSLEDPLKVWRSRMAALRTGIDAERLYHGDVHPDDYGPLAAAIERTRHAGIELVDEAAAKASEVRDAIAYLLREKQCDVVYLDYVQAATVSAKDGRWDKAYAEIAKTAKREAKRFGVPLVISSQLKRVEGSNAFIEPSVRDLKETGDLENEAEVVVLLWPESDAEGATVLGKVAKLKWGQSKPRFRLDIANGVVVGVTRALLDDGPAESPLYSRRRPS